MGTQLRYVLVAIGVTAACGGSEEPTGGGGAGGEGAGPSSERFDLLVDVTSTFEAPSEFALLEGATVAVELDDGARIETTSNDAGLASFEGVTANEIASVLVTKDGYAFTGLTGGVLRERIDKYGSPPIVHVDSLTPAEPERVNLHGTVLGFTANALYVGTSIAGTKGPPGFGNASWSLDVRRGKQFTMAAVGFAFSPDPLPNADVWLWGELRGAWVNEAGPFDADQAVPISFNDERPRLKTASGQFKLAAHPKLRHDGFHQAEVHFYDQGWQGVVGAAFKAWRSEDAEHARFEATWIDVPNVVTVYFATVGHVTQSEGSPQIVSTVVSDEPIADGFDPAFLSPPEAVLEHGALPLTELLHWEIDGGPLPQYVIFVLNDASASLRGRFLSLPDEDLDLGPLYDAAGLDELLYGGTLTGFLFACTARGVWSCAKGAAGTKFLVLP